MIEILILSLIQGVTEFLPISSSSHLFIISEFMEFESQNLSIDVSLHIGSFLAVITYFRKDFLNFTKNTKIFIKILISSIPVILVGFFLVKTNLINELRNIKLIAWMTIIFGILLYISDKFEIDKSIEKNFSYKSAIIIGIFQILSLIPGVSRSGITITAARILHFKRFDAAKISFLLSIPTLGAVSFYGITNIISSTNLYFSILNILSIILSFFFSLITIRYFLKYLKKFNLNVFIYYRIFLGSILLFFAYSQ